MANYSPQHFEPRAKAVNVKGVANRRRRNRFDGGLIAQPLMSPAGGQSPHRQPVTAILFRGGVVL